ncbi:MAG: hormogonium polysaccharide biosynthesis glycosyltransferase HpsE [Leptolyngbyaceae cyanobacterium]|mgnify:CR=1 FL=1
MMTVDYSSNKAANPPIALPPTRLDITVVIPTYNGADRIPQVLDRLLQQISGRAWEVIVCDNNSTDDTAEVVLSYQQRWPRASLLRYCFVAEQGAAFARQRGVAEADGQIVAFLDDDNVPAVDWLENVWQFAIAHPQAGAFGSQIHGDFHGDLPAEFEQIACYLAIVERGSVPHLYSPKSKILPPAAGLAVRRVAWLDAVPKRLFLNHKGKSAGLASEDLEAMLYIQKAGWEIWYNADMVITHQIPSERLQQEYLVSLLRCIGLSRFYIRWLGIKDWQRPFKVPAYIANDLRKLAIHYLKNGLRQTDLTTVAACERSLLTSIVVSPGFLLRKLSQDLWQTWQDNSLLPNRQKWLQRLTDAFESQQLELYQQAVVCMGAELTTDKLAAAKFEILLRLRQDSAEQPPVTPAQFFPTAERYGLMRTLDRRVVQQVCGKLGATVSSSIYSLNLSAATVGDPGFSHFLEKQLYEHRVNPACLYFEISEAVLLNLEHDAYRLMGQLKRLGVGVIVDEITRMVEVSDYGPGLSVDCLKLSKQLVDRLSKGQDMIFLDWVKLVQRRGIQVVAKGVDTPAVLEQLRTLGIECIQGYQLSKPVPFDPTV